MYCKSSSSGFTLVELMIIIAVIGILAAIAIPTYSAFVARAQFAEALSLTAGAKTAVNDSYQQRDTLVGLNNGVGAIPPANTMSGTYVANVDVTDGVITTSFQADSALANAVVVLHPTVEGDSLQWQCQTTAAPAQTPSTCEAVTEIVPVETGD